MRELTCHEIAEINGAVSEDAAYGASIAVSAAFLVTAIAAGTVLAPVTIGILAAGSIVASGVAIYEAS